MEKDRLAEKILELFPELRVHVAAATDSRSLMLEIVPWVEGNHLDRSLALQRLKALVAWAETAPSGDDDPYSIVHVFLLEEVAKSDELWELAPRLVSLEDFQINHDYWVQWVGQSRMKQILERFEDEAP